MRFILFAMGFTLLLTILERPLAGMTERTAWAVAATSALLGVGARALEGSVVAFGDGAFTFVIDGPCTGLSVMACFAAAVLAYPTEWGRRGMGLLVGIPLILFVNLVRLVSVGWVGLYDERLFMQVHEFWWQAIFILTVGAGWLAWAARAPSSFAPRAPRSAPVGSSPWGTLRRHAAFAGLFLLAFVCVWTVILVGGVAPLFGGAVRAVASRVSGGPATVYDSLASVHLAAFTSLCLVSPASFRRRLVGALFMVVVVFLYYVLVLVALNSGVAEVGRIFSSWIVQFSVALSAWFVWAWRAGAFREMRVGA